MDDFNVINSADDDDGELQYPVDDEMGASGLRTISSEDVASPEDEEEDVMSALESSGIEASIRNRKRRIEALENISENYGLHPLDWHMRMPVMATEIATKGFQSAAKRQALEELQRKLNEAVAEENRRGPSIAGKENFEDEGFDEKSVSQICDEEFRRRFHRREEVMSMPPIDGSPWMGISGTESRLYVRMFRDRKGQKENLLDAVMRQMSRQSFGYRAFQEIMNEAEQIKIRKEEANKKEKEAEFEKILEAIDNDDVMEVDGDPTKCSALWVNKYAARNFAELLSDDVVNRNLLIWLKLWDECVFKRKNEKILSGVNEKDREIFQMDSGKVRRPHYKIVLLSGPAGLGKTTLAGIVARQAGYATMDVNASDARTNADLQRVLEGAVKTTRTLDADSRPSCLILDEIDGCAVDTIRNLVKAIQASGKKALRRPIIGICNNLYAPAIRELRAIALCIQLGPTNQENLTRRLQLICDREDLRCDLATLRRLCELCACDMRHAINSLQWVAVAARKRRIPITSKLVQEVIERERSGTSSIFENWQTMFDLKRHLDSKGRVFSIHDRAVRIERLALDYGDDRFVSGLHANYLVSLPVAVLRKAAGWFQFYDLLQRIIHSYQNYTPMRYSFAFYVSLHLLLATHAKVSVQYPQVEQSMFSKVEVSFNGESTDTLDTVRMGGETSRSVSRNKLLLDVLPLLVRIVQPPIKPMNEHLYTQREQSLLNSAVAAMCDYGLTFVPTIIKEQVNYLFQPAVDVLTMFEVVDDKKRVYLANATRQLLAHKITLLRVNLLDRDAATVLTNTAKIKELVAAEKEKTTSSDSKSTRRRLRQFGDVHFEFLGGDQNAVKKKISMSNFSALATSSQFRIWSLRVLIRVCRSVFDVFGCSPSDVLH
ncbi:unnamed protein product [Caenorhabditis auriculariae]|uniref:AAA+ ATPase domain-containing protein n=1 Tax=Caenorhabditis auriculariae TaxID=2777116 RepID=A0A8S1HN57_9PELO|nr:unnamed protein product [Caenorhabditis auriculariae]